MPIKLTLSGSAGEKVGEIRKERVRSFMPHSIVSQLHKPPCVPTVGTLHYDFEEAPFRSLLPGRSCLKTKSNPMRNKTNSALLLKEQPQKHLLSFWGKENPSLPESKGKAISIASPDSESLGGPPRETSGGVSSEPSQAEASQRRGAGILEQGPIAPLAEPSGSVRPAWSQSGPLYVLSLSSAWAVGSPSQADQDLKNSQESALITSSASIAIGPCDFTLQDLDPVLFQRYGPQITKDQKEAVSRDPNQPNVAPRQSLVDQRAPRAPPRASQKMRRTWMYAPKRGVFKAFVLAM
ncbi:hypothetical protein NDU88_006449 [Pleurodeles waltl]|uniref:Uncharacterized protein n=1 Tax=Pleurodeles waltl TaxID=8319 RepID=A0AAV7RMI9_PLEWA|nr:hypothetical protein NDU88_006449 [Pleurodeles waltl]